IASLPMMIASIVIEKVVSMLVPAAGAILTIVQGLMAAWQSLSSILTAFSKFWAYLKAVKAGPAACLFAEAVAAGIVALLDFIANFLMIRLEMSTKGIGKRLKAMAQKIMKGLKKTGKGAKKAAGGAVNRARGAIRKAGQALRQPARPTRPKPARPSPAPDRNPAGSRPDHRPEHRSPQKSAPEGKRDPDGRDSQRTPSPPGRGPNADRQDFEKPDQNKPSESKRESERDKDREGKTSSAPKKPPDRTDSNTSGKKNNETPRSKSLPKRVLGRVKSTVKSALKKVRNAGRTLGKKLRRSKLGRAISKSAKTLRDKYLKRVKNLRKFNRDQKRKNEEERNSRKNEDQNQKQSHEQENKRPTVRAAFSMSGERHHMILKPNGGDVNVQMESELLPLQDQYSNAYNNIEYIKSYVNSIQDPEVRSRFQEELLDDVVNFQKDSVREYKEVFKQAFPNRSMELNRPRKFQRRQLRNRVSRLLLELRVMNGKISRWASTTGIEGFNRSEFDKALLKKGETIWDSEYKAIKATIDKVVDRHHYKGKRLRYVGSLNTGMRGPHKGKTAFNINDFDVDLFVVHPEEWKRAYPHMKRDYPNFVDDQKMFPRRPHLNDLVNKSQEVGGDLANAVRGRLKDLSEFYKTEIVLRWQDSY
ncbi:MAG: hypothetical protein ACRD1T_02610, partial [Acidimicrobiia bacterium]